MSILKFLGWGNAETNEQRSSAETETVRRIVARLADLPDERARYIAAFAYMLARVAHGDLDVSDAETAAMERIAVECGGLPEAQAVLVVQMAKTQSLLFGGTEHYLVAKEFNRMATREQKLELLHSLFAVGAADESISSTEDNVVRQIADELELDHADFIAVRARFREKLAVFHKRAET